MMKSVRLTILVFSLAFFSVFAPSTVMALPIDQAVESIADQLVAEQAPDGSWPGEECYTGSIVAGLVNRDGKILHRYSTRAHSEKQPGFVVDAIEQAYRAIIEGSQVKTTGIEAVGLGFPGNTNGPAGIVLVCSNLPAWDHIPLRDIVAERIGVPVVLDNDTNLCAVGEHRYGAGRGASNMCYVTLAPVTG